MQGNRKRFTMSLIEVVTLPRGSARMGVYTLEHCPPHATCKDLAGQWEIRISFSFLDSTVDLMSIRPVQNNPGPSIINLLAHAVRQKLAECRHLWWTYQRHNPASQAQGACCLNNIVYAGGVVVAATYDPGTSSTRTRFSNGAIVDWPL
jgi:hypothetical protein